MAELTAEGLDTATQDEILDGIEADQIAEISDELDQSTSSPLGQLNRLMARSVRLAEEALSALYMAMDPDSASGDALLRLAAITGTIREPATASRVPVTIDVDAGTYAIGSLVAAPAGRPADRFGNIEEIISSGGSETVVFEAQSTGPIAVSADALEIADPVSGWNSITSHPAATLGSEIESEAALRIRRQVEIESPGSSSVAGIAADITREIALVETVSVTENVTDSTVDSIPPHSIEVIVYGPATPTDADDDAVAAQILAAKAAGIGTYGTTTRTILDSQGHAHTIKFTRPSDFPITVALTVAVNSQTYAGDVALKDHLAARAAEVFVPGLNASFDQIIDWAREVTGVIRVTAVSLNATPFGSITISTRQKASLATASITVTSAGATP